jgi:hypothetical protein
MKTKNNMYIFADELAEMLDCSKGYAYRKIRELNKELADNGKITVPGRVSRKYFEERCAL